MIQCQVLNRILSTQDASLITLNNLSDIFFSDYPQEYAFIDSHLKQYGNVPDFNTFIVAFPNFDVIQVNETTNYLVDELFQDRKKRHLAKTFNTVRELLNAGDVDKAMSIYITSMEDAVKAQHVTCVDIFKDTSRYDAYVEKCNDFSKFYIKTGFKELDELIGGWDKGEDLVTIVARPGVGKSWLLDKCALAGAEQGLVVGLYSGEMSENKVGYRLDTFISNLSNTQMIRGNPNIQLDYKKHLEELPTKFKGTIKILTPKMLGDLATVTSLRAFIEKEHLDMLCIDQHSLLEDERKAKNPVDKASNISRDLKKLQVLKNIPIITVSQQNRESTESGVSTAHIAQSDRISQDSTILIFLEQKDGVLTLNLVKARDATRDKKLQYAVDFDKGIFTFIPTESDGLSGNRCDALKDEYEYSKDSQEDVF